MKIAFLGDSLTWGGYGGDWVAVVAERLPEHAIINAGQGGNTVVNLWRRVDEVLDADPDVIYTMVGGNDAVSYTYPATRPYYKKAQALESGFVAPEAFAQTYRDLLTHILLHRVQVMVGLAPTEYNQTLLQARDVYNGLAQQVARSLNVPVCDLTPHFEPAAEPGQGPVTLAFIQEIGARSARGWDAYEAERQRLGYRFTFDGMHITPATAQRFADIVVACLREHFLEA